jgi:zinc/manganese transport system substrate-binding protein
MRNRLPYLAALAALLLPIAGCAGPTTSSGPAVVVTTNILGDVVTELVGDQADVTVLMPAGGDPHSFEISAQQAAQMRSADLLVSNGLGLEEGIAAHVTAASADGIPHVSVGEHATPLTYDYEGSSGLPDPHFWTDPGRMLAVVDVLEASLGEITAVDTAALSDSADAYRAELETLAADMDAAFAAIPDDARKLITNHHVFGYLAERFDFEVLGAIIPSGTTLAAPSASDLASLTDAIRDTGVTAIFADSSQPNRLAQVVADETGLEIAVIPLHTESLTEAGGGADTYLQMMRDNTERIVDGLTPSA